MNNPFFNVIFIAIILVISFVIYVLPFGLLLNLLADIPVVHIGSFAASMILAVIIAFYLRTHSSSRLWGGITFYGMGFGFIALPIAIIGHIIAMILPLYRVEIGLACLVGLAGLGAMSIKKAHDITIERLSFNSRKVKKQVKFTFISDIHLGSNAVSHLEKICALIKQDEIDFLLIGGDLFDASSFDASQLEPFKQITCPIYYVTGNHEYYVANHLDKLSHLAHYNITMLDNTARDADGLNLIGISDNLRKNQQKDAATDLINDKKFNLLMVHQPSLWGDMPKGTDLMLSGHTHHGQIFPFNFLVRLQFKAVYGLYQKDDMAIYVSSGAGTWGPRMRLGTQNEIVHITIAPQ